ncbi:MAG TPA: adenosine deaminase [Solirubrobacteraceae bacterium]|nr:adenosine deaminase [Solirubrobacteraceae bacterium]
MRVPPPPDRAVPKAELHVHLEGTAPPELVRRLAKRNGLPVPEGVFAGEETFAWSDFLHFLRTYDLAASVIRTAEDYRDVTFEYLAGCAAEGAVYIELIASPDHASAVGLSDEEHYAGIAQGIDDARDAHHIEARIVIAAVRNLGVEAAEAIAHRHAEDRHPYVVGFNLVGDEAAWPADRFARAYEIAAGAGLGCTVHAGEHSGPESIRAALTLPVSRISHGVRAIEDPTLVAELADRGVVLEVCPSSNVALRVYPSYEAHPLGSLREAGVRVTLGSDDPPYFGCSIGTEYAVARRCHGFEEEQLIDVTRLAVQAGFAEDAVKDAVLARLRSDGRRGTD